MSPPSNHTCCDRRQVRKGLWTPEEDEKLVKFINKYGHGCWSTLPKYAGLERCGKSCRLRWMNYLRPNLKRGTFNPQEAALVIEWHKFVGNKWSHISNFVPGRTDNEIKNFWNSGLKRKIMAHQKHSQAVNKTAAAAASFAQNQNLFYVNPNQRINDYRMPVLNQMILPAPVSFAPNFALNAPPPVQVYVPAAPFEVQAPATVDVQALSPLQASHFLDSPCPIVDNNPQWLTQNNQNLARPYQFDDHFVSQFNAPTLLSLDDGNFLSLNQDPPPPAVFSFNPDLDQVQESGAVPLSPAAYRETVLGGAPLLGENQEGMPLDLGSHAMKVIPHQIELIDFGAPLPSAVQGQDVEQPLIAESKGMHAFESPQMKFPPHHINFIESRMASFVAYAPPPSALAPATFSYLQQEYYPVAQPAADDAEFRMDPDVATPSSSWDFSEFA